MNLFVTWPRKQPSYRAVRPAWDHWTSVGGAVPGSTPVFIRHLRAQPACVRMRRSNLAAAAGTQGVLNRDASGFLLRLPEPFLVSICRVGKLQPNHFKEPQTGWLKRQDFIFSQFWRVEVQGQGSSSVGFFWGPSPWPLVGCVFLPVSSCGLPSVGRRRFIFCWNETKAIII